MTPREMSMSLYFFGGGLTAAAGGVIWLDFDPGRLAIGGVAVVIIAVLFRAWIGSRWWNPSDSEEDGEGVETR